MSTSKEYFDIVNNSPTTNDFVTSKDYLQTPLSLYTNTRSDMSQNITNNLRGASEDLVHKQSLNPSRAKRDVQAGIQYYTPHLGTNPRVNLPPIIGPRIYDSQVWGKSSTVFPNMNFSKTRDITETELQIPDLAGHSTSIGVPIVYRTSLENSVLPQNNINQPTYDGYYPSEMDAELGGMDERDFNRDILPILHNPLNEEEDPLYTINENLYPSESMASLTEINPNHMSLADAQKQMDQAVKKEKENQYKNKKENFYYTNNLNNNTDNLMNTNTNQPNYPLSQQFYNQGRTIQPNQYYDVMNRVPPGQNWQPNTVTEQLLPVSPTYMYTDDYFNQPDKRYFLQDLQPKLYSYTVDQQPINSNVGITYAPQNPPPVLDQITDSRLSRPIYTRIDPQLVRTDGTRAQRALQPTRTNWSAEYSNFVPPEGSINYEDIYDPRFTSYGDPYRSYSDVNLGQVQYYYSDIDAYRYPNFVSRSNVDFIEYRTPQGQIWPEYQRTAGVDDTRSHVESQYTADDTFHREDLMSRQMAKANRIAWAQRFAPLRQRGANSHASTYGPGV